MGRSSRKTVRLAAFFWFVIDVCGQNATTSSTGELPQRGKTLDDGSFLPGTLGSEWTPPKNKDLNRVNNAQSNEITNWATTSWAEVDCCKRLTDDNIWEHRSTGVPDCFCRDFLKETEYKTVGFCALEQVCENALKDWNKVFGEGYMVPGRAPVWGTESPARTCMREKDGWQTRPCGEENKDEFADPWVDPYGRILPVRGYLPSKDYGTVITDEDLNSNSHWRWIPGDVPQAKKVWHGFGAADNKIQAGLMDGSRVYPGRNHSSCCSDNTTNACCRNSDFMRWTKPVDAVQADCMYAVKRAICSYHFWECDKSYHNKIYNGVCQHTCDDIPRLCGTIPSTGELLELRKFTLGKFYHLGCTDKKREYIKDCTASAPPRRAARFSRFTSFLAGLALVFAVSFR
mmetsp:Transcript_54970/g.128573  ORF Transcript_54970/g.128573 Transcript_54970/m.128573 type:complete len:401 (+) Transcript_54970:140-1342(+)